MHDHNNVDYTSDHYARFESEGMDLALAELTFRDWVELICLGSVLLLVTAVIGYIVL